MVVANGSMEKLSDLFLAQNQGKTQIQKPDPRASQSSLAQRQWAGAIAALEQLLLAHAARGVVLSGPVPVLSHPQLVQNFSTGIFNPRAYKNLSLSCYQLPSTDLDFLGSVSEQILEFPLLPQDPIVYEQFCLVFTKEFATLMVLGEDERGVSTFHFSFDPEIILRAQKMLHARLVITNYPQRQQLEELIKNFQPSVPSYQLITEFSRALLNNLPSAPLETKKLVHNGDNRENPAEIPPAHPPDIELLQALTHEIRTPLTTIRTMARLLLKRASLTADVLKCLEVIDLECTEQINRMELILKATEMQATAPRPKEIQLVSTSIEQVFQQNIPQWQKQAKRRNVKLDVVLPQNLPQVTSDPRMLAQMLTGLMEKCTRNVAAGGHIQVQVSTAGHQLKLQVYSQSPCSLNPLRALGQLLMFQPETGSLSLSLDVTKNLFQALGGKLVVRQRPQQGEIMTVFLPLDDGV